MGKVGAFWKHVDKNGKQYLSGTVELDGQKYPLAIFKNDFKKTNEHPDYNVVLSEKGTPRHDPDEF